MRERPGRRHLLLIRKSGPHKARPLSMYIDTYIYVVCESEPASVCVIKRPRDLERLLKPVCLPEPLLVVRAAAKLSDGCSAHRRENCFFFFCCFSRRIFAAAWGFFYRRLMCLPNKTGGVMTRVWKLHTRECRWINGAQIRPARGGSFDLWNPRAPRLVRGACIILFASGMTI